MFGVSHLRPSARDNKTFYGLESVSGDEVDDPFL